MVSLSAKFDRFAQRIADIGSAGCPAALFVGDVIFHSGTGIDFQLTTIDRAPETTIVNCGVDVIRIVFRIVNMFFRTVYAKPLFGNLYIVSWFLSKWDITSNSPVA